MSPEEEEYYVVPVIPTEDSLLHTDEHPFCYNNCGCHFNDTLIAPVNEAYQEGLLSAEEGIAYIAGKLIYGGW